VPANCQVILELSIAADYSMTVTAEVPSANIKQTTKVPLPRIPVPSIEDLRIEFDETRAMYEARLENAPSGPEKMKIAAECERIIAEATELLVEEHPEAFQISMLIKKLYLQAKQIPAALELTPPQHTMEALFAEARELHPRRSARSRS